MSNKAALRITIKDKALLATPLPPMVRGSARAALQHATASIHEALHHHPYFAQLLLGRLNRAEYAALLARLHGFYFPLEQMLRVDAPASMPVDMQRREKAPFLHADLVALGMPAATIALLPQCTSLPKIRSREHAMGCLYVLEGAALGGTVMAHKLDVLLGPGGNKGRTFFLGKAGLMGRDGADPLPWASFCELLETCAAQGSLDEIKEGARTTFQSLSQWLNTQIEHV